MPHRCAHRFAMTGQEVRRSGTMWASSPTGAGQGVRQIAAITNKKSPPARAKDDAAHRDTTLLRRLLTQTASWSAITLPRCHGRARPNLRPSSGPRPGGSGAMFPHPRHARFHRAGLSCGGTIWGTLSLTAFIFHFLPLFYPLLLPLSMFLLGFGGGCGTIFYIICHGGLRV